MENDKEKEMERDILARIRTLFALERNYLAEERTCLAVFRTGLSLSLMIPPLVLLTFSLNVQMNSFLAFLYYAFIISILGFGIGMILLSRTKLIKIRKLKRKVKISEKKIIESSKSAKDLLKESMSFE